MTKSLIFVPNSGLYSAVKAVSFVLSWLRPIGLHSADRASHYSFAVSKRIIWLSRLALYKLVIIELALALSFRKVLISAAVGSDPDSSIVLTGVGSARTVLF